MEYKREELIALMREMEKQIALCHIRPQLAGAIADELERSEPVVRCRDCKYGSWDSEPDDAMVCIRCGLDGWYSGNSFCSYGKRKDGE